MVLDSIQAQANFTYQTSLLYLLIFTIICLSTKKKEYDGFTASISRKRVVSLEMTWDWERLSKFLSFAKVCLTLNK